MDIKVSDYIVEFFIRKGITDVFGYPGGSVANIMDSLQKRKQEICAHVMYHEQAAAFAACAYAQMKGCPGAAYATGGPGATNLMTGIGHAFCDSIPVIFLTGNVNTYEAKGDKKIRQQAFQEFDNISVIRPITKFSAYVDRPEKIRYYLEKAYAAAMEGRRGPVLLDIPMDVQRAQVDEKDLQGYQQPSAYISDDRDCFAEKLEMLLAKAERPCVIYGNGIKSSQLSEAACRAVEHLHIPYVTSMTAFDVLGDHPYYFGFLGAYGMRTANFIAAKSDLIISIGSRLDVRQVGADRKKFAPDAEILRIDLDAEELKYKVHENEYSFCMSAEYALEVMNQVNSEKDYRHWLSVCEKLRENLSGYDDRIPNEYIRKISKLVPQNAVITTDVGQNQVWVAQSFMLKKGQTVLFSGGMGAMGHALPAAIGAYYGSGKRPVVCICGDGGMQMNIQELQYLAREKIPVKMIVLNNHALGMIRHFQEMYFDSCFFQTNASGGYTSPDFALIAGAYGLSHAVCMSPGEAEDCKELMDSALPALIEIKIFEHTYVFPKLEFGKPNQDQQPRLDRALYEQLNALE